jgi:hypothetical protein
MDTEIEGYKMCSENDRPEIVAKYGIPYVIRLEEKRQKFIDRLKQL